MQRLRTIIASTFSNRQSKNSLFLLTASLATAAFGFVFWIIAARLFTASTVGVATVLISLSSLISLLSLSGFDSSFVRFLPKSRRKNDYINSGIIVSTVLSTILSFLFLAFAYATTPDLRDLISQPVVVVLFVFLTVASSLNLLTNSIFLAYREAQYILFINILFNLIKVVLPFAFIAHGSVGIFSAAGIAQVAGLGFSFYYMRKQYGYTPSLLIDRHALRQTFSYTFGVYIGSVLNLLPPTLLPLIITQQIGAASTAYYYMAFNIVTIIFTIGYSAMQSAFAESAHDETQLKRHVVHGISSSLLFILPAILFAFILGHPILTVFGHEYATSAETLLRVMSVSAIIVTFYSALGAVLKIAHDTKSFIITNAIYSLIIVVGSYLLIPAYGLVAIGYMWIAANIAAVIIGTMCHVRFRRMMNHAPH